MGKVHDSSLLRELKKAYEYYIAGDVAAFDVTLERIVLTFGSNIKRINNNIEDALRGEIIIERRSRGRKIKDIPATAE